MQRKSLNIHRQTGDQPNVAHAYGNLANCYQQKGDTARALECYRKSLDITDRIGDLHTSANTYFNLGLLYPENIGDQNEARANLEKAKAFYEQVGDARGAQQAARALLVA